jgi:nucleoid-associated protein YgaU
MKTIFKISVVAVVLSSVLMVDLPFRPVQLVPEAQAIFGVWRRHARRWAVIGTAAVATTAAATTAAAASETAAAQQQAAAAQQQAAAAQQQTATAQNQAATAQHQAAAAAATAGKLLPIGTIVSALPSGCVSTPVGGVEYYYCGGNFYRAVFQGNQLVYVTAQPK